MVYVTIITSPPLSDGWIFLERKRKVQEKKELIAMVSALRFQSTGIDSTNSFLSNSFPL
jgi:hypothetical protein